MKTKWKKIWSKRHSIRLSESWCYGNMGFEKMYGVPFPTQRIEIHNNFGSGYVDEEGYGKMLGYFVKRIKSEGFFNVLGDVEKVYLDFFYYSKEFVENKLSELTDFQLFEKLN